MTPSGHADMLGARAQAIGGIPMRRLSILVLAAMCLAALAPAASAGRTRVGTDYLVNPGETITFDGTLDGCNHLQAGVEIHQDGAISAIPIGDNDGHGCSVFSFDVVSVTNDTASDQLFRLFLTDVSCDVTFFANGDHAKVTSRQAAINDAGAGCFLEFAPAVPGKVQGKPVGNFTVVVSIE
jgi:hypothetical protein